MKNSSLHYYIKLLTIGCLLLLSTTPALAADVAGTVELIDGTVWIQGADSKIRSIKNDQPLYEGDIIITGQDGELQARMQDEAIIAVRPNSKLKIESYRAEGDEDDNAVFSLLIGTFRSVTGWIGKYNRKNYAIKTTAATIGVRGTDHEPMYIPPPVPGMKPLGEPGVYDKVNAGRIVIKNKFGETEFGKGQAGFVGLQARAAAIRLKNVPEFFKASRHEQRIAKIKQQRQLDRGLIRKQQMLKQQRNNRQPGRPLPRMLKPERLKRGFVPGPDANDKHPGKPQLDEQRPQRKIIPPPPIKRPQTPEPIRQLKPISPPTLPQQKMRAPDNRVKPVLATPGRLPTKALPAPAPVVKKLPTSSPDGTRSETQDKEEQSPAIVKPQLQPRQIQDSDRLQIEPIRTLQQPVLKLPAN